MSSPYSEWTTVHLKQLEHFAHARARPLDDHECIQRTDAMAAFCMLPSARKNPCSGPTIELSCLSCSLACRSFIAFACGNVRILYKLPYREEQSRFIGHICSAVRHVQCTLSARAHISADTTFMYCSRSHLMRTTEWKCACSTRARVFVRRAQCSVVSV